MHKVHVKFFLSKKKSIRVHHALMKITQILTAPINHFQTAPSNKIQRNSHVTIRHLVNNDHGNEIKLNLQSSFHL